MRVVIELLLVIIVTVMFKGLFGLIFKFKPEITDGKGSRRSRINLVLWVVSLILANGAVFLIERYILRY